MRLLLRKNHNCKFAPIALLSLCVWTAPVFADDILPESAGLSSQPAAAPTRAATSATAPASGTKAVADGGRSYSTYREMTTDLVTAIAGSTQRVYVTTNYFTDGDLLSSLILAQYRRLSVKVLLGRAKANQYMSRLGNLKAQGIPVGLRPASMFAKDQSIVVTDNRIFFISTELNFLTKDRLFKVRQGHADELDLFVSHFEQAISNSKELKAAPIPLVGTARGARPGAAKRKATTGVGSLPPTTTTGAIIETFPAPEGSNEAPAAEPAPRNVVEPTGSLDHNGVYTYSNERGERPPQLPAKLPRETIVQQRSRAPKVKKPGTNGQAQAQDGTPMASEAEIGDNKGIAPGNSSPEQGTSSTSGFDTGTTP